MKQLAHFVAFVCSVSLLTACGGESTTEEPLPEGASPSEVQRVEGDSTDAPSAEAHGSDTQPAGETAKYPPLPVPENDAERLKASGISYVLPEGWSVGPERQMRLLTLLPPNGDGADLAISNWPGDVGGFASNVQRWVRQVGLAPISGLTTAAASDFEKFNVGGTTATWIPLMNEETNVAILAVWVPRGDSPENPTETWTFKLTCKADQVEALAPAIRAWCDSIQFED